MLCLVVNVALKWRILEEVAVLVIDVLEVFLIDNVIYNIPLHVQFMLSIIGICHFSYVPFLFVF
jgi:hypothetical protein